MARRHDGFVAESERARTATLAAVRKAVEDAETEAHVTASLDHAPLAPFLEVRTPDGSIIVQISAHADSANALVGYDGTLCAFDSGSIDDRAQQVAGAVAVLLAHRR